LISFSSNNTTFRLKNKAQVRKWLELFIRQSGFVSKDISIVFCSDEFLLEMNRNYLKHDYYTDIITFDYSDNQTLSGELFISVERVEENARDLGMVKDEELFRVIAHGVLHLMGLKDKSRSDALRMRKAEDAALQLLKGEIAKNLD
jgi:rRNA maturation RNase YbeY